ncbi:ferredoxin NADP reductase, putative [Plasmodium gallinaceum]|uniref:ferredoxin--NADP(+) reductase n=1 Tax=Plasmodium gallinaceum TaxID=5849 RepID=A0A1J1GRA3_PLAGA|nr:ferredoxin NADP reductase, putative [Plasmodium gallinaceum]CRG93808.1 ferredoxin NADP reductase, putative [Plasmodium gallinaceum]
MKIHFILILSFLIQGIYSDNNCVHKYAMKNKRMYNRTLFLEGTFKKKKNFRNYNNKEYNNYINLYTIKNPLKCKVVDIIKLVREKSLSEVYNIEICHNGKFKYLEGQSCGIIPYYNENDSTEDSNKNDGRKIKKQARLYSISSGDSKNLSVAIKIHKYEDIENGVKKLKYGYCSGFIKNIKKNNDIYLTGSHGSFFLPDDVVEKNKNLIFIATGTGISPYISFLKKILGYDKNNMKKKSNYNGLIHLFYGVYNEDSILYLNELEYFKKIYPYNLHIHYVFSSIKNLDGTSFHVQDEIFRKKKEFLELFNVNKSELYICGHKSIRKKIIEIIKNNEPFDEEKKKRIHVEVY